MQQRVSSHVQCHLPRQIGMELTMATYGYLSIVSRSRAISISRFSAHTSRILPAIVGSMSGAQHGHAEGKVQKGVSC